MKDVLIKLFENDKAMVIFAAFWLGIGALFKLADPTNIIIPIVTGLFGVVTGVAIGKVNSGAAPPAVPKAPVPPADIPGLTGKNSQ